MLGREKGYRKSYYAVGAGLQEQAREDYAPCRRRLCVRVRQPGMERNSRKFYEKCSQESPQEDLSHPRVHGRGHQGGVVEGVDAGGASVNEIESENGTKHEKTAELRKDKKLYPCTESVLVSPEGDEKKHGHEHELPRKIEKEEVQGEEYAENA